MIIKTHCGSLINKKNKTTRHIVKKLIQFKTTFYDDDSLVSLNCFLFLCSYEIYFLIMLINIYYYIQDDFYNNKHSLLFQNVLIFLG